MEKLCKQCGQVRSILDFHKHNSTKDGYQTRCKVCRLGHEPYKKPTIEKLCKGCNEVKTLDNFGYANKEKGWHLTQCKTCRNAWQTEKEKSGSRKSQKKNQKLRNRYSINLEDYNRMLEEQRGVCKICKQKETSSFRGTLKDLAVDHCHSTGKVRGLLCGKCNTSLGGFKDNIEFLEAAIKYLKENNC